MGSWRDSRCEIKTESHETQEMDNGFVSAEILEYEMGRKAAKIAETEKMVCLPEPWEKRVFASVGFDIRNQRREEIAVECVRHGCSPTETGDDLQF